MKDSIFQSTPRDQVDFLNMKTIPFSIVFVSFDYLTHCKSS